MPASNSGSDAGVLVRLSRFSYAYPDRADFVLKQVTMAIGTGECHCIVGPTGSGKTTLLLAIRGLLPPEGRRQGEVILAGGGGRPRARAGLVLQNPETQLLGTSLGAEVAFGLENHCVAPHQMATRVRAALAKVGLNRALDMTIDRLSMGQKYRGLLAGLLVMEPDLLLLDEPGAQLDPRGLEKLAAVIKALKQAGKSLLICDHRPELLASVIDACWQIDAAGRIFQLQKIPAAAQNRNVADPPGRMPDEARVVIRARGIGLQTEAGTDIWSDLSFCVKQGERIAIHGPNGAGKTSLVRCLAGLARPDCGSIEVLGTRPEKGLCRGKIGVLFQNPQKQLFETTVLDEAAFAARRLGKSDQTVEKKVRNLLTRLGIDHLRGTSPHKLSFGQKHLVALASVLAGDPQILILDDPFAGLDRESTRRVMDLLAEASAHGTTVLWTVHHPQMLEQWASRTISLAGLRKGAPLETSRDPSGPVPSEKRLAPLIKTPAGAMLALSLTLSIFAFAARTVPLLALLTGINLVVLALACPRPFSIMGRSLRFFFWQTALIVVLYAIRFGLQTGALAGARVGWQLFLAFWPAMIFMASTSQPRITKALSRVLPHRTAFVIAVCLKFLPVLMREMQSIRETQILRGARLMPRDIKNPRYWPDWIRCLLVPTLIQTLSLSGDIALAASARDFGIHGRRTCWPGD